jgi:CheY-like chemotaxis protein
MESDNRDKTGKGFGVVLLIEDDDVVMDVGRAMIEKLGYTVLAAKTAAEALDLVNHHEGLIDLAMLDMDLPDMKGKDLFPLLADARPQMKIVICSGDYIEPGNTTVIPFEPHEFLQKPYAFKSLETLLVKYLDRRVDPRIPAMDDFLAVSDQKGVYSIRLIDISRGGLAFACENGRSNEDALVDVAILMAEKGVNLDDLECRVVSDKTFRPEDLDGESVPMKRKSVSFGRMTRDQFERLSELINTCSKKE